MDDLPLVDGAQIKRLEEWGGEGLKKKMIDLFFTHGRERLEEIVEGVRADDAKKAETGAHTLKSSAGNVGAQRVQRMAQDAEAMAEAGEMKRLQGLLPALEEEFVAACSALEEALEATEA